MRPSARRPRASPVNYSWFVVTRTHTGINGAVFPARTCSITSSETFPGGARPLRTGARKLICPTLLALKRQFCACLQWLGCVLHSIHLRGLDNTLQRTYTLADVLRGMEAGAVMNLFAGANAAFVLLCIVVMVAISTIIALLAFVRREWPVEREVDELQQYKLHQRLAEITDNKVQAKRSA